MTECIITCGHQGRKIQIVQLVQYDITNRKLSNKMILCILSVYIVYLLFITVYKRVLVGYKNSFNCYFFAQFVQQMSYIDGMRR